MNLLRNIGAVILVLSPIFAFSFQNDQVARVSGRVNDAETGFPIDNATIYIPYSYIGTFSGTDGRFQLSLVPIGKHDLVIQRLGYEPLTASILLKKGDSLYYDITLKPKPVQAAEVEILGQRPNELRIQPFFFPHDTSDIFCVYGPASSVPIGILYADSAIYIYALEAAVIDSQKYVRLWLLYKNLSSSEREFDPHILLKLVMTRKQGMARVIVPESAERMLAKVKKAEAVEMISSVFKTSLENLAVKQSMLAYYGGARFELLLILDQLLHQNKTRESFEPASFEPAQTGSLSASMYSAYNSSVSVGILGRYKVFPQNSLNGYVYFAFPGINWKSGGPFFSESMQYNYRLEIDTPTGVKTIEFTPQ